MGLILRPFSAASKSIDVYVLSICVSGLSGPCIGGRSVLIASRWGWNARPVTSKVVIKTNGCFAYRGSLITGTVIAISRFRPSIPIQRASFPREPVIKSLFVLLHSTRTPRGTSESQRKAVSEIRALTLRHLSTKRIRRGMPFG